jgi:hypothetical protein
MFTELCTEESVAKSFFVTYPFDEACDSVDLPLPVRISQMQFYVFVKHACTFPHNTACTSLKCFF